MKYNDARMREDYKFTICGIENFREEIKAGAFSNFGEFEEENGVAEWGLAVLEVGWLSLEVNLGAKPENGGYRNEPEVSYFCLVKGLPYPSLIKMGEWSDAGYLDDFGIEVDVDFSKKNWKQLLEKDMFEKLNQFADMCQLSFEEPNWSGKDHAMDCFDRIHGVTRLA